MKVYSICKSPLYKLSNKRKLATLLSCDIKELKKLKYSRQNYNVWGKKKKNNTETRSIESPKPFIKRLQKNLYRLLKRIETPEFLLSGKKGIGFADNAKYHSVMGCGYILAIDIKDFYQSVTRDHIFKAFKNIFSMSEDVAWLITDLVSIPTTDGNNGYIPTGAPSSQAIAFWSCYQFFMYIYKLARDNNINMTVYVDDITFSSNRRIPKHFISLLDKKFLKFGLKLKRNKTNLSGPKTSKYITGAILNKNNEVKVPNNKRAGIINMIRKKDLTMLNKQNIDSLYGKLNSARQIEPVFSTLHKKILHLIKKI